MTSETMGDPIACRECGEAFATESERDTAAYLDGMHYQCWVTKTEQARAARQAELDADPEYQAALEAREMERRETAGFPKRFLKLSWQGAIVPSAGEDADRFMRRVRERGRIGVLPGDVAAVAAARRLNGGSAALVGPPGSGKTTIACLIAYDAMKRGCSAMFIRESAMFQHEAQRRELPFGRKGASVLEVAQAADIVVLDDLATVVEPRPWQVSLMESLVCARYDDARDLIITSNADMVTICTLYGRRVGGRLMEMIGDRMLTIAAADWRSGTLHPRPVPAT